MWNVLFWQNIWIQCSLVPWNKSWQIDISNHWAINHPLPFLGPFCLVTQKAIKAQTKQKSAKDWCKCRYSQSQFVFRTSIVRNFWILTEVVRLYFCEAVFNHARVVGSWHLFPAMWFRSLCGLHGDKIFRVAFVVYEGPNSESPKKLSFVYTVRIFQIQTKISDPLALWN